MSLAVVFAAGYVLVKRFWLVFLFDFPFPFLLTAVLLMVMAYRCGLISIVCEYVVLVERSSPVFNTIVEYN